MSRWRSNVWLVVVMGALFTMIGGCLESVKSAGSSIRGKKDSDQKATETTSQVTGDREQFDPELFLGSLDKNGDKKLSKDEYGVVCPGKETADRNFQKIDVNGDGFITAEEIAAMGQPQ